MKLLLILIFLFSVESYAISGGSEVGNGGNTLNSEPATVDDLNTSVYKARSFLYFHFKAIEPVDLSINSFLAPLYNSKKTIYDVIKENQIFVSPKGCSTRDGARDGSTASPHAFSICISKERILKKLRRDNLFSEVLGLVAHEYSHLLGFNESQANRLQVMVRKKMQENLPARLLNEYNLKLSLPFSTLEYLEGITSSGPSWNRFCYASERIRKEFIEIRKFQIIKTSKISAEPVFQIFGPTEYKEFSNRYAVLEMLYWKSCARSDYHPEAAFFERDYNRLFAGKQEISASDAVLGADSAIMIQKVNNLTDAAEAMKRVRSLASELYTIPQYLHSLTANYY